MDSRQPRHRPLPFVGFVVRTTWPQVSVAEPLTETHEGFAGGGGRPACIARARRCRLPRSGTTAPWSRGRRGGFSAGRWGRRRWWVEGEKRTSQAGRVEVVSGACAWL
jgi:hypothetical protein